MKQKSKQSIPSNLSNRSADLSPAKRALLQERLKEKDLDSIVKQSIPRRATPESPPLSFAQQRLWFLDQYEPNSSIYNISYGLRLAGRLNVAALEQTLREIVRRHEALRTTFSMVGGEPVQIIAPSLNHSLLIVDLRDRYENEREDEARRLASEEARRAFDLIRGPLFRTTLIRLGEDDHVLLLTMHHIVSDGWSMGVFYRELSVLYQTFTKGQPSPLLELAIQYADYAVWQREWLKGDVLESQLSYWKKQLEGVPGVLNLPTDRPRPAVQSFRGAQRSIELSKELTERLKALGRKKGVTLYMTLLAAFQALLHRYTGQKDIVVGSPIANRNRTEQEGLIGFFVNTLVLRTNFSGNPTFCELLYRVREMALEAYAHQDLPLEKLVEELRPDRDLSRSPLFQAMFVFQNAPSTTLRIEGLNVSPVRIGVETAKFDLTFSLHEEIEKLKGSLQYNTDLFDEATIMRMLGHFQTLLEGIVLHPEQRISDLPILTEAERCQLLVEWNETKRDYTKEKYLHQLFEEQVKRTPEAVAVVFEDQQLTYRELNHKANQVAHYLQKQGVGPDDLVGICMERSVEMVIGLLGILKAGGAYVPLDPAYPNDRIAYILNDTQASILLTEKRLLEDFGLKSIEISADQIGCGDSRFSVLESHLTAICLDRDWQEISRESRENLQNQATPSNLAYVIYTSGSTGLPKGVMIEHRNAVAFLSWAHSVFTQEELAGVIASTSICFDLSIFELFAPLTCGGRVLLLENALALSDLDPALEPTLINTVPSVMIELLRLRDFPASICTVNLAGEPLRTSLVQEIYERTSARQVYDLYGPSETTTYSTYTHRTADGVQTIGRPIGNTQVYILDPHLNPVPIGVVGELHIGGNGLARGYFSRPELTKQKFIANPFSADATSRLYKTGDLARYLPDGNIEFLGRIDNQIKLRGYRIELGEIEAVLGQHPAVREAVVLAREDSPEDPAASPRTDKRLVAYVVAPPDTSTTELRSFLKQKLPEFMVPAAFVCLDSLPLTPSGKVDRRALPAPDQSRPESGRSYTAPRTAVEELIAGIWAEVLKVNQVGIHDNFFELGGHSLLATRVISRVGATCQVEIPLRFLFEAPTVAGLAERIEQTRRGEMGSPVLPILPMPRTGDLPLSFAQQRLWFLDQLEPNSSVYNVPSGLRLKGPLDISALEQSLNEIVRRHEALRTTFSMVEGQPVQRISPSMRLALPVIDLSYLPESEREDEARRLTNEEAQRPFDLERGPLARSVLLHLGSEDHILPLTLHHIASDGWSMSILYRELSALYEAFSNGKPSPLETLPVQYADFAQWQREWLQGDVLGTQLGYWKMQLENVQTLQLPTDRPRPAVQSYRGARQSIVLSRELSEALKTLSRQQGVTLFMTLLAAFQTLLYRYTGQEDIAVGSPIAGRNRREIEELIGFFVNTLVLRTDLSGDPSFLEVLGRVRESSLEAYAHQDVPFEKLVEELQPTRNLSQNPLFQVMFILQNAPREALEFAGLTMSSVKIDSTKAKFDLTLSIQNEGEGLRGSLQYSSDLFNLETITRMLGHFRNLLEGIVANPEQRISEIPLLTEAERHQLLVEWNDTRRDYPKDKCIHQLFEEQVERTPEAAAVVFEDQQLTYRELNNRANQLAHYLQKLGVSPEVLVGICLERSLEMIVALLGILKAGGVYVPLDPGYPKERLAFMLQDTQADVLMTQERLVQVLPHHRAQLVCLDADWEKFIQQSSENPLRQTTAEDAAYVIYTSGSTGKPKGVLVSHGSIANHCVDIQRYYELDEKDRVLQFASLNFDASIEQILPTLISGATLVLRGSEVWTPEELQTKILDSELTVVNLPTAYWHHVAQAWADGSESIASHGLRLVIVGGEGMSPNALRLWQQTPLNRVRLLNAYGPTETTITATSFEISPDYSTDTPSRMIPIGRPLGNRKIYILDRYGNPVPIGEAGELHIGGDGLARGYLNRPELTAEKFIGNPFSNDGAARLYKTGDRARYLPDGNIEFLGRMDNQVKLRGYRIELGEIEAVLGQHPAIREAVVTVREDNPGHKQLVGYVVDRMLSELKVSELRGYLKEKLPEYMVPSAFVFLDKLPLTANGKVDRRALPAPTQSRPELDETFSVPRTPTEDLLANIWAVVLKLEKVGIHDNFFDLGGHSLLATQVMSRLTKAFQIELPLRSLFESPTVAGLAERIEASRRKEQGLPALAFLPRPRDGDLPLSFAQQRLWFLDQLEPNSSVYNIPTGQRLKGPLDIGALEQSLNEIVRRHEALRTRFSMVRGEPVQVISPSVNHSLLVVDLRDRSENEREQEALRLAHAEMRRPFDLSQGPLFRTSLLRLGEDDQVLLMTLHHIVSDGWSMGVLYRELTVLYQAFSQGQPSPLPELAIQYADYAVWQREWLQGEVLERQLSYWKKQLENLSTLQLPTDRPRRAVQSYRGSRQSLVLPRDLSEKLKTLSRKEGVTLFMTLLAAFQTLLHRYTAQDDIAVGSPIAGRNQSEIENLIGFFVNTLVMRTDMSGDPTFREVLGLVREVSLGAYAHQDVPFEKLLVELRAERDLSRSPLFQVFFNMVNVGESHVDLYGLKVEEMPTGGSGSKFDLTIYARERPDGIQLNLVYNPDLFEPGRMVEMLRQYEKLLSQITENPNRSISSFPLLTHRAEKVLPNPKEPLCSDWVGAVQEQFSRQAQYLPEKIAILDSHDQWTYRELNARSNQLAHYLLESGIQREDIVAIYGHRSAAIAWALLGTLKAGAAFLILDPAYPAARLLDYVTDAKPRGLIQIEAAGAIPNELAEFIEKSIHCRITLPRQKALMTEDPLKKYSSADSRIPLGPDDLACISYTSGSTGEPKGILGRHGPLSHFLPWQADKFSLTSSDRFSVLSGLSHDPLQREIFTSLWIGATIYFPDPEIIGSPGQLAQWMAQKQITFAHLTPALGRLLTETASPGCRLSSLRHAFFVGDKLTWADVDSLRRLAPHVTCVNYYGSTETQRAVSYYEVPLEPSAVSRKPVIPVGRGMPDVQLLILNKEKGLAGIGELGEIYMRSPHLARGYLNDEPLTNTRFLINPFTQDGSDRLYKTGDLGRYLLDGNVEILWRSDGQIKIRGFRIEPAEIESLLIQHSKVRETVVTLHENSSGNQWLVGYVVPQESPAPSIHELRSFLKKKLPDYMVPPAFVFLNSLPLTPNGKVDYRALPDPQSQDVQVHREYVAPRDETERVLCRVWSEVLGIDGVRLDDDFFAIGGHSLLAAKLFTRLDEEFGRSLPLGILFSAPTVRALAEHYRVSKKTRKTSPLVALSTAGTLPPVYAVPGVYGNILAYADLARELGSEQPFYGIQSVGLDGAEAPLESIEEMASWYISDLQSIQSHGPYALVGACFGATVAYEMARQLLNAGQEVAFLGLLDPTRREGYEANENPISSPRTIKRAKTLGSFLRHRLRLYLKEMRGLGAGDRFKFATKKIRSLSFKIQDRKTLRGIRREIQQLEVIRANVRALDRYNRKPLTGRLRAVEIFETSHPRNTTEWTVDWKTLWDGQTVRHHLPGKDSGDMVSGKNARILAALLTERLREAFGHSSEQPAREKLMDK